MRVNNARFDFERRKNMNENEVKELELETTEVCEDYEPECAGGGFGKLAAGIGFVAVAGLTAVVIKNKKKLEERKIERLRKKGYVIYRTEEVKEIQEVDDDFDEEDVSEEN